MTCTARDESSVAAYPKAATLEGPANCCPVCLAEGDWYLLRRGDAVVSWACDDDLPAVLRAMQRDFERTQVTVKERQR